MTLTLAPAFAAPADVSRRLGVLALLLLWLATWTLSHGYDGIRHDALLYSLQALARLQPESLSQDVFLSFGSQDRYTVFSPLYAGLSGLLGIEPAALTLTLILQLALVAAAFLLVRKVASPALTLLGLSALIVIPGTYGAGRIFSCIETFVTPRMGAEALVLCGLAAALSGKNRLAPVLVILALLLHPLMAAAGVVALLCLRVALPRPRFAALLVAVGVLILIGAALSVPAGPLVRFDTAWLGLVQERSPYLFLHSWTLDDWSRAVVPLATLLVGSIVLPLACDSAAKAHRARALSVAALLTALGGLALTLIACDWLQIVLVTQMQPWRWQWLATAVAALLLPLVTASCWKVGASGKITALLLAAAWIFASGMPALVSALAALVAALLANRLRPGEVRLVFYGACGLVLIAVAARIATNLLFMDMYYLDPRSPRWIRQAASFSQDGSVPFAVMLLVAMLASRPRGTPGVIVLAVVAAVACIALFPDAWSRYSQRQFPAALEQRFAPWRALIPPGKNIFWSESPAQTWILLRRPSYLSVSQTSGIVFSRAAAMEMQRRAIALHAVAPPSSFLDLAGGGAGIGPSRQQLQRACETGEFEFVVSGTTLGWTPAATLPREAWHSSGGLRLYRCSDRPRA